MKAFFHEQYKYNEWANEKLLEFVEVNNFKSNSINPIFSHLTLAQVMWRDRLKSKDTPVNINEWATWPWDEIEEKCRRSSKDLIAYVEDPIDLEKSIEFVNTSGTKYRRSVKQILNHILYYTSFHRGQIVGIIHQKENIPTPSLDYIDYVNG